MDTAVRKIEPVYPCPHCKKTYKTEEEALSCGKRLTDLVQEGDVVDFARLHYGQIRLVDRQGYISADATKDYILAKGYSIRSYFDYKSVAWMDHYICGGSPVHDNYLMKQKVADDLVKNLTKRLKYAKSLQQKVKAMWDRRGNA